MRKGTRVFPQDNRIRYLSSKSLCLWSCQVAATAAVVQPITTQSTCAATTSIPCALHKDSSLQRTGLVREPACDHHTAPEIDACCIPELSTAAATLQVSSRLLVVPCTHIPWPLMVPPSLEE